MPPVQWDKLFVFTVSPFELFLRGSGKAIPRNTQKQFVTHAQLHSMLRERGVDEVSKVKAAYLEGNGQLSVIPYEDEEKVEPTDGRKRKLS